LYASVCRSYVVLCFVVETRRGRGANKMTLGSEHSGRRRVEETKSLCWNADCVRQPTLAAAPTHATTAIRLSFVGVAVSVHPVGNLSPCIGDRWHRASSHRCIPTRLMRLFAIIRDRNLIAKSHNLDARSHAH